MSHLVKLGVGIVGFTLGMGELGARFFEGVGRFNDRAQGFFDFAGERRVVEAFYELCSLGFVRHDTEVACQLSGKSVFE